MSDSNNQGSLSELQAYVSANWRTDGVASYPVLERLNEQDAERFLRQHPLRHLHKQLGKIEAIEERLDHDDGEIRHDAHVELLGKTLLNLMRYAELSGVTGDELGNWITDFYRNESR